MSNEQQIQKQLTKYKLITDPKVTEELDKLPLYIPPNETEETYDQELLVGEAHDINRSKESVGQLREIEVAVWFEDPNKDSSNSIERIHLRIINGRHRYKTDPNWKRKYYDFSYYAKSKDSDPVVEYYLAKGHFDMQKKATKEERAVWVNNMCEHAMKILGVPAQQCCQWVVDLAKNQGISSTRRIIEVCPPEFKTAEKVLAREGMTWEKSGKETNAIKKMKKVAGEKFVEMEAKKLHLETENTRLQKESIGLNEQLNEKDRLIEDMQQQLRLVANIDQEHTCKCGQKTKLSVDASSGKILVSENAGTARLVTN